MVSKKAVILAGAGLGLVGVGALLMFPPGMGSVSVLELSFDSSKGTVLVNNVETLPGRYDFAYNQTLTIEAIPNLPPFGGWMVDGTTYGTGTILQLPLVSPYHLATALFDIGIPNGGTYIPSTIYPDSVDIGFTQNIGARYLQGALGGGEIEVKYVASNWNWFDAIGWTTEYARFKVEDSAGHACPNIPVEVWTDNMPDNNDTGMILSIDGAAHGPLNRLIVYTLADGYCQAPLRYYPANLKAFCQKHIHAFIITPPFSKGVCVYDGYTYAGGLFIQSWSIKDQCPDGSDVTRPSRYNAVHAVSAKIKDTILQSAITVSCEVALDLM